VPSLCLCLCLSTEQYTEDDVDIDVSVNGQVIGRRRLSYTSSSLDVARRLSTFYCRLLNVVCQQHHHRRHHHHQPPPQQQQQQSASEAVDDRSVLEELDQALVNTIDDESTLACQTLFTVYRHGTRNIRRNL